MESICNEIGPAFQEMRNFNIPGVSVLDQKLIQFGSQVRVKNLELVLKEELHQSTGTFHSLIAVVVTIVQLCGVVQAVDQFFHH